MSNLKLTIELIPKGAWGNNLRERLSQKDWDILRNFCYNKAKHRCTICGKEDVELEAHEVWDFNINEKTQTLKDIIALCPACHGVKHFRNSTRIGYGEHSKAHFLKVNKCSPLQLASHYAEAEFLFEECNEVLRWTLKADLSKFGGKDMEIKKRNIPFIVDPYDNIDVSISTASGNFKAVKTSLSSNFLEPKVRKIVVDNYEGAITVVTNYTNKIQWISGSKILNTKYNVIGKFTTKFSVENLECNGLYFKIIGEGGETISQPFKLTKAI